MTLSEAKQVCHVKSLCHRFWANVEDGKTPVRAPGAEKVTLEANKVALQAKLARLEGMHALHTVISSALIVHSMILHYSSLYVKVVDVSAIGPQAARTTC